MRDLIALRTGTDGPETVRYHPETATVEPYGGPLRPTHRLVRAPLNAHTHVGDAFLTGRVPRLGLGETVAPPDGFKHRMLRRAAPHEVVDGMARALSDMARAGTRRIVDFREDGVGGLDLLSRAIKAAEHVPLVARLGRPDGPADARGVLDAADGLGLSSVVDDSGRDLAALADAAHAAGKLFALHLSEGRREDVEAALALGPDLLVHLCHATRDDVRRVADADVPVVVCPTSNAWFGLTPAVRLLEAEGVEWLLGTDNAMLGGRDVVGEAARLRGAFPELPDESLVRALEANGVEARWGLDAGRERPPVAFRLTATGGIDWSARASEPPYMPPALAARSG